MTRLLAWPRLAYRLQRFELLTLLGGTVLYLGLALLAVNRLDAIRAENASCFGPALLAVPGCDGVAKTWDTWRTVADYLVKTAWALPFLVGLVLGIPIVARELEQRTASITWGLSLSRIGWLAGRTWPIVLVALVTLGAIGFAANAVASAALPDHHLTTDFTWYDRRGILVALRGLLALATGVLAGSVLGRVLPALLVAMALTALIMSGLVAGIQAWRATDTVASTSTAGAEAGIVVDWKIRTSDGRLLSLIEADAERVIPNNLVPDQATPPPGYTFGQEIAYLVPGEHLPMWLGREAVLTVLITVLIALAAASVVARRRPL